MLLATLLIHNRVTNYTIQLHIKLEGADPMTENFLQLSTASMVVSVKRKADLQP